MKFENEKLMTLLLIYYHIDSPNRYNARYLNFALLNYIKKKAMYLFQEVQLYYAITKQYYLLVTANCTCN